MATKKAEQVQDEIGVQWRGHKSKHSNAIGSGGYSASAHNAQLHVQQDREGKWHFTVETFRVGVGISTLEEAKAAALVLAERLEKVK